MIDEEKCKKQMKILYNFRLEIDRDGYSLYIDPDCCLQLINRYDICLNVLVIDKAEIDED